jgi:hypothetical protein
MQCADLVANMFGSSLNRPGMLSCLFASTQAEAFAMSGRDRTVKAYALAVADAINGGGDQVTKAYAQAFASASAGQYTEMAVSQGSHVDTMIHT